VGYPGLGPELDNLQRSQEPVDRSLELVDHRSHHGWRLAIFRLGKDQLEIVGVRVGLGRLVRLELGLEHLEESLVRRIVGRRRMEFVGIEEIALVEG